MKRSWLELVEWISGSEGRVSFPRLVDLYCLHISGIDSLDFICHSSFPNLKKTSLILDPDGSFNEMNSWHCIEEPFPANP